MNDPKKDLIRKTLRTKRAELSLESANQMSSAIAKSVIESDIFKSSINIGFYHSVRGEADPATIQNTSKNFYLPVLSKNIDEGLVFIKLDNDTKFENNKFDIPEPVYDETKIVSGDYLDLVIAPLLGFDKHGHRLGMGGGFYDRCFSFKKLGKKKPVLMGYAYDFQQLNSLKAEPWDVNLDMIATESGLVTVLQS